MTNIMEQKRVREPLRLGKAGFRTDELRDEHGLWAKELIDRERQQSQLIAYNGRYHNRLVHELSEDLRQRGGIVIENFKITAYNGMTAIADALVRNKKGELYILEIKTGDDPTFTLKQSFVYPYVCFGNHAISEQKNIGEVGLVPGQPLPKMPVIVYESPSPGVEKLKGDICIQYQ